jgi:hypothetical protein
MSVVRARHHPLPCQHHHQFLSRQQQYFPAFFTEQSKSHLFNFTFMDWICTCCN